VSNREITNTSFPFDTSILSMTPMVQNNMNINISIDTPRDRSINSSANNSKKSLAHSIISSISYVERIEAQNNNPS